MGAVRLQAYAPSPKCDCDVCQKDGITRCRGEIWRASENPTDEEREALREATQLREEDEYVEAARVLGWGEPDWAGGDEPEDDDGGTTQTTLQDLL